MKENCKKWLVAGLMLIATLVFAGADDVLLAFSTRGPDCYADGSSVLVGECYALVWMREGTEFAGIDLNGNAVDTNNNEVVAALPLAKARRDGAVRCPMTLFQINKTYAQAHTNGSYALVLLDTRKMNADGTKLVATGNSSQVNGWGFATKSRVKAVSGGVIDSTAKEDDVGVKASDKSVIPADENIPQPRITGIQVKNGYVWLTVKGTSPRLLYNIASGSRPGSIDKRHAATAPVQGHSRADREITVITPVEKGQNFFRVIRN